MTKLTLTVSILGLVALSACSQNREPSTVRVGPQLESPYANAPGGKLPAAEERLELAAEAGSRVVIIDDTAAPRTGSIIQTVFP